MVPQKRERTWAPRVTSRSRCSATLVCCGTNRKKKVKKTRPDVSDRQTSPDAPGKKKMDFFGPVDPNTTRGHRQTPPNAASRSSQHAQKSPFCRRGINHRPFSSRGRSHSAAFLPYLRSCSALPPQLFRITSALLPHCFRTASALLPNCFRTASALLPHCWRNRSPPPSAHSAARVKGMHQPRPGAVACSSTGGRRRPMSLRSRRALPLDSGPSAMALPPPLDSGGGGKQ